MIAIRRAVSAAGQASYCQRIRKVFRKRFAIPPEVRTTVEETEYKNRISTRRKRDPITGVLGTARLRNCADFEIALRALG
jgi:hypothetical protein